MCQFTDNNGRPTLADFVEFPKDVYPAGRLDFDSEGLVLLTNDGLLKHKLLDPKFRHPRTYLVQIERLPSPEALDRLRQGVIIDGKKTLPAGVKLLEDEPAFPPRPVPIRFRKNVPTAWLELTIREGRNRQARKMTAAAGHPALRLIRIAVANLALDGIKPGEHRTLSPQEIAGLRSLLKA